MIGAKQGIWGWKHVGPPSTFNLPHIILFFYFNCTIYIGCIDLCHESHPRSSYIFYTHTHSRQQHNQSSCWNESQEKPIKTQRFRIHKNGGDSVEVCREVEEGGEMADERTKGSSLHHLEMCCFAFVLSRLEFFFFLWIQFPGTGTLYT